MPVLSYLSTLLLLLLVHFKARGPTTQASPSQACPSCRMLGGARRLLQDEAGEPSTSSLALGEPCGVYTLNCAKGLRCVPPPQDQTPLQALLQGRGVCAKQSQVGTVQKPGITDAHPSNFSDLEKAPCRKLLFSVLRGFELTVFQSHRDIYIPNCDTRGFYRKKQCHSSKGKQRGHCWCVDEYGTKQPSQVEDDGTLPCEGD